MKVSAPVKMKANTPPNSITPFNAFSTSPRKQTKMFKVLYFPLRTKELEVMEFTFVIGHISVNAWPIVDYAVNAVCHDSYENDG